jgi:CubicO group peptidase (beta-lactamase class C family)
MNNINELNHFIEQGMKELGVPGLSIAIIESDKIIFEKGYGVTKWGDHKPVTSHTLMKIGSITKSFTTLLMAKLIDEGKFDWNTKAHSLYPKFKVDDESLSKTLDMEQLVSANTGLPRTDFPMMFNYYQLSPFQQLALIKPTMKLKESYQYNNQLFSVAGYIAAHAAEPDKPMEQAFMDLMEKKVIEPIGMNETVFPIGAPGTTLKPKGDYALPHSTSLDGTPYVLTLHDDQFTDFIKPDDNIWSNAHDMGLYIITELQKGINPEGKRVFGEKNLMNRRVPQIKVSYDAYYGLGWYIFKNKGLIDIEHPGQSNGFYSRLYFFPEKESGIVILTNNANTGGQLIEAIKAKILELWFGAHEKSAEKLEFALKQEKLKIDGFKGLKELSADLMDPLLGKHKNKKLGVFEIKEDKGNYYLDVNNGIYKTQLMTLEGEKGEQSLVMVAPPFGGEMLVPSKDGSFKLIEEQNTYIFKKAE